MKKYLQKKLNNEKGMTLIELLAVIVIIAIIAAIAIPAISGIIENSRVGAIKSDAQNVISAGELYFTDAPTSVTSVTLDDLATNGFVEDVGSFDGAAATTVFVTRSTSTTPTSINGIGQTGNINIEFTTATRDEIESVANSARATDAPVAITED